MMEGLNAQQRATDTDGKGQAGSTKTKRGGGGGPTLGLGLTAAQLAELQHSLDADGSGEIDFNEFVQGVPRLLARMYEQHQQKDVAAMTPIERAEWLDTEWCELALGPGAARGPA